MQVYNLLNQVILAQEVSQALLIPTDQEATGADAISVLGLTKEDVEQTITHKGLSRFSEVQRKSHSVILLLLSLLPTQLLFFSFQEKHNLYQHILPELEEQLRLKCFQIAEFNDPAFSQTGLVIRSLHNDHFRPTPCFCRQQKDSTV